MSLGNWMLLAQAGALAYALWLTVDIRRKRSWNENEWGAISGGIMVVSRLRRDGFLVFQHPANCAKHHGAELCNCGLHHMETELERLAKMLEKKYGPFPEAV